MKKILITEDVANDLIYEWHTTKPNCKLYEYLSMTKKEYERFLITAQLPKRNLWFISGGL